MSDAVLRPIPRPSEESAEFWAATTEGRFLIQRCGPCGEAIFYPRATCPKCGSEDLAMEDASGRGIVYTFTISRRPTHPAFADDTPYVIAIVELEEGPHVTTNIVEIDPDDVTIGMAVEVTFAPERDGVALPLFRPA